MFIRRQSAKTRRGVTVVETVLVVALSAVILSTCAVGLHALYRTERKVRDDIATSNTLTHLSHQFRADAHSAMSIRTEDGDEPDAAPRLVLVLDDERVIEYSATPTGIIRVRRDGEATTHRDTFRMPEGTTLEWNESGGDSARAIKLQVNYQVGPEAAEHIVRRTARIHAAIGLDHRFVKVEQP